MTVMPPALAIGCPPSVTDWVTAGDGAVPLGPGGAVLAGEGDEELDDADCDVAGERAFLLGEAGAAAAAVGVAHVPQVRLAGAVDHRQPRPVGQRLADGEADVGLDAPQQVGAGRGAGLPQGDGPEAAVGEQQHARLQAPGEGGGEFLLAVGHCLQSRFRRCGQLLLCWWELRFLVVWLSPGVRGFRPVLARDWHGASDYKKY